MAPAHTASLVTPFLRSQYFLVALLALGAQAFLPASMPKLSKTVVL